MDRMVWRANGYERRLAASDQAHYPGLAMRKPNKHTCVIALRLLTCGCRPLDATSSGGLVYGAHRAMFAPTHAQRIIGITGDGDQGLIALPRSCGSHGRNSVLTSPGVGM